MKSFINKLKEIKKDELDERSFYEEVLSVIQGMEDVSLTPETAEELKTTLQDIGCLGYDEWKAEKDKNGEIIEENNMGKGIEQADISTAVSFVSQLLGDYNNASFSLSYMLDGGEKYGWVQQWLKNSKELYSVKEELAGNISSHIAELKEIKKDELDERSFYEQVLSVIQGMEDVSLTPETAEQLKIALQEIGCMNYDEWKAEKDKNGETIEENNMGKGIEQADISTAVTFVSQLLGDYKNASFSLPYMLDGGEKYGWVQQWLKNSKELYSAKEELAGNISSHIAALKEIKKDELDERSFYEEVLSVIQGMEDVSLTPETAEQLKIALQNIGCMRYEEWKAEKDKNGEKVEENNVGKGIEQADISTAVSFVSQLLGDYKNASFSLPYMLDGGEKYGWVQQWLKNSDVRKKMVAQIIDNPTAYDIEKLSESEKIQVEQALGKEVDTLTAQRDELHQKNSIVQRIVALAKRRSEIKEEISIEEQKKNKNIQSLDD